MSAGGFTLGDRLGLKVAECRVRGCTRTWTDLSANPALAEATTGADETRGMCEPCRRRWAKLNDREMACARPGCEGTWHWSRQAQLENQAAGRPEPSHFCGSCEQKLKELEPVETVCAVPECGRAARLTPKQQLLGETGAVESKPGGITLAGALCKRCAEKAPQLDDVQVACGIQKCKRTWTWKADEQISAFASGKPSNAPRRMCEPCREAFGKLADRDVRCRASGCKRAWVWTRAQQLDACVADKPAPKPPAHLCEECFKIWSGLKDTERPCRRSGCKNTWIEKRGAQLARALRGKTGEPYPQFCASCTSQVAALQDRQVGCKTEGCKNTWTWSAQQQFLAGARPDLPEAASEKAEAPSAAFALPGPEPVRTEPTDEGEAEEAVAVETVAEDTGATPVMRAEDVSEAGAEAGSEDGAEEGPAEAPTSGEAAPAGKSKRRRRRRRRHQIHAPSRHCGFCSDFLSKHKTVELPCASCGTPIFWPPESQLQTALGNWEIPKICGACKRDVTEAERQKARSELIEHAQRAGTAESETGVGAESTPAEPSSATESDVAAPADPVVASEPSP